MSRPATLAEFIAAADAPDRSLAVVNSRQPAPVQRLLEGAFDGQPVDVDEREALDAPDGALDAPDGALDAPDEASGAASDGTSDGVYLLDADGAVLARSPLRAVMESFLLVNADLYRTGTSGLDEYEAPDVLAGLADTRFRMRGFPASNKEKLLLIVVSRYIEHLARRAGAGTLRASFQRLSRIEDERGTRRVYERLADAGVDVHVYGVPDRVPDGLDATVHAGSDEEYRRSWFVVYAPPDDGDAGGADGTARAHDASGADGTRAVSDRTPSPVPGAPDHAALACLEAGDNEWDGTWTYDPERVRALDRYVAESF